MECRATETVHTVRLGWTSPRVCLVSLLPFLSCICTEQDREIEPKPAASSLDSKQLFHASQGSGGRKLGIHNPQVMQATFPCCHLPSEEHQLISRRVFQLELYNPSLKTASIPLTAGGEKPKETTDNRGRPTSDSDTAAFQRQQSSFYNSYKEKLMKLRTILLG